MLDRNEAHMQQFRSTLDFCSLLDLGFQGWPFTWSNRKEGSAETWVRLDRGVCTKEWLNLFPNARLRHVSVATSDHLGLLLDTVGFSQLSHRKKRQFRFEQSWTKDPSCEAIISEAWALNVERTKMYKVCQKIKACKVHLLNWNRTIDNGRARSIQEKRVLLQECEKHLDANQNRARASQLRVELNSQLEEEEVYWKQRSRVSWLKEGDQNTKFFHAFANQRKRNNEITMLCDNQGVVITGDAGLEQVSTEYFQNIFSSSNPNRIDTVVESIEQVVSPDMNDILLSPYSEDEVRILCSRCTHLSLLAQMECHQRFSRNFGMLLALISPMQCWIVFPLEEF